MSFIIVLIAILIGCIVGFIVLTKGNPLVLVRRFFALKELIFLQHWGYDTNNKPIPNAEGNASQGIFKSNTLDTFMNDYLKKSDCWTVVPIELRFDGVRGVWIERPSTEGK